MGKSNPNKNLLNMLLSNNSISNLLALPPETVFTKVWNGSQALSERLVISKFGVLLHYTNRDCLKLPPEQSNVHITQLSSISIIGAPSHTFLCLQQSTFIRGARVVFVR
jgi:hypothetical protein